MNAPSNWGRWGPDDEIGTANFITPEIIVQAARLVKKGEVVSLAIPLNPRTPTDLSRPPMQHFVRSARLRVADHGWGGESEFADDWISMAPQTGTQWDGLCHAFREGKIYNGYDAGQAINPVIGARKCSIDKLATYFVTRGVLLDLPKYKQRQEGLLPAGYAVTAEDLEGATRSQGIEVRRGDALMIRTGWLASWYRATPKEQERFFDQAAGLGMSAAEWLHQKEVACIGVDNLGVEVSPAEDGKAMLPLHPVLIRDLGLTIGELFWLDDLAKACARDQRYDFLFVGQPLRISGGLGSPINPLAIR
jgi:kynurenine formamidase